MCQDVTLHTRLEAAWEWRIEEILDLQKALAFSGSPERADRHRKVLVVMLYSHLEGFVKESFLEYVNFLNNQNLPCSAVVDPVIAGTHHLEFYGLRNPNLKSQVFVNDLPDDTKLHAFARDVEFVSKIRDFGTKVVTIPESVVDTSSNVTEIVLRKILYRLGLDWSTFDEESKALGRLLGIRNAVAHGARRAPVTSVDYEEYRKCVQSIVSKVIAILTAAVREQQYLRNPDQAAS